MIEAGEGAQLWRFSLDLYSKAPMQQACLAWQHEFNIDINQFLYAIWQSSRQVQLHIDDVQRLIQMVHIWRQDIVLPLRRVRKRLQTYPGFESGAVNADSFAPAKLYQGVLEQEIEAEHYQQLEMAAMALPQSVREEVDFPILVKRNIATYLAAEGHVIDNIERRLEVLVSTIQVCQR